MGILKIDLHHLDATVLIPSHLHVPATYIEGITVEGGERAVEVASPLPIFHDLAPAADLLGLIWVSRYDASMSSCR